MQLLSYIHRATEPVTSMYLYLYLLKPENSSKYHFKHSVHSLHKLGQAVTVHAVKVDVELRAAAIAQSA